MIDLKPYREKLFPEVDDFSDPMNHLRYPKDKRLSLAEMVWFSPSFYKDFTNWFCILSSVGLIILFIYSIITKKLVGLFLIIVIYLAIKQTIKTIKNNKISGDVNLWDLLIRDNSIIGNKVKGKFD